MRKMLAALVASSLLLTGCASISASFFSPLNGNAPAYRSMIVKQDSLRAASHISGSVYLGAANEFTHPNAVFAVNTSVSRSHVIGKFGLRYGLNLGLGGFHVAKMDKSSLTDPAVDPEYISSHKGNYFFGSYGADGAVHYLYNNERVEWRVIGIEWSVNNEFGNYLSFRKQMPATASPYIDRGSWFNTAGIYTEVVDVHKGGRRNSFKFGTGQSIPSRKYPSRTFHFRYYSFAFTVTRDKWTGSTLYIAGQKAYGLQLGLSYRLGN